MAVVALGNIGYGFLFRGLGWPLMARSALGYGFTYSLVALLS